MVRFFFLVVLLLSPNTFALDSKTKTVEIPAILTSQDYKGIPASGYPFKVILQYSLTGESEYPVQGTKAKNYKAVITTFGGAPNQSYLGKALLISSNWISEFCTKTATTKHLWPYTKASSHIFTFIPEKLEQSVSFEFSCWEALNK